MTIQELPLIVQTSFAELIDQLRLANASAFPKSSTFRKRTISGREYWYVQEPTGQKGRPPERYLGADTPERRAAIEGAKCAKTDANARRTIRRSLSAAGLSEPDTLTAAIVDALAEAGVFRLRGVIVGTVAFQTYAGFLGIKLPGAAIRTGDLDLAQDYGVSVALNETLDMSLLDILKSVDSSFAPVPALAGPNVAATYARPGGYRVDVLTTNRGADRDEPVNLPSLQSDAVPLRFLDYLLKETVEAAVLTRFGALVNVPSPERYAVHKLIVSVMRRDTRESAVKSDKDLVQAGLLIEALVAKRRRDDLADALREAAERGASWKDKLTAAVARLPDAPRAIMRSILDDV
ncbi:MAG: GSU2403 family nucleotidyltransferase fold protein [Alphaproteobacteria bacterium]|nr:GSU2403 family nucleotidyltransferase fold protein [Alphaproteobacteria bacterium]